VRTLLFTYVRNFTHAPHKIVVKTPYNGVHEQWVNPQGELAFTECEWEYSFELHELHGRFCGIVDFDPEGFARIELAWPN